MKGRGTILILLLLIFLIPDKVFGYNGFDVEDDFSLESEYLTTNFDTVPPIEDREGSFVDDTNNNPFDLKDPPAIEKIVTYDPESGYYIIQEKVGDMDYRPPTYLTLSEYLEWSSKEQENDFFKERKDDGLLGADKDPIDRYAGEIKSALIDRLFGGTTVDIRPNGSIDLTFGVDYQEVDNPLLTEIQRRNGGFDFDMAIKMDVIGKIGDKMQLSTNYNTLATFDFDDQIKLEYNGFEDDIVRKIEAGNVSMPLKSSLIQGSSSLFGIRTDLQFGRLAVSAVASQKKSRRQQVKIEDGAQIQEFEVTSDMYDENRHFFLSHYNRDAYEDALLEMPNILSLFKITRMEVWVTNDRNESKDVRNIVALADIGETRVNPNSQFFQSFPLPLEPVCSEIRDPECNGNYETFSLPCNEGNRLYSRILASPQTRNLDNAVSTLTSSQFGLKQSEDFEKVGARLLRQSEYTVNPELGYISVNSSLQQDAILGVAFEYTHNGQVYRVGEFANDLPPGADSLSVLYVKMLKSTAPRVDLPIWDLMMKNIYSIGAFQVNSQDFELDVLYDDPKDGAEKRFISAGPPEVNNVPLISVLNLDNLNSYNDRIPDGNFDFVSGITINPRNGRITFPVLEPFGSSLKEKFQGDPVADEFTYQELYDETVTKAREFAEKNRFLIRGTYKSSVSSEISLGAFNIPEGSVKVTAGGKELVEGVDYTIDYNIGRIKILNEAYLNNGSPVNVSYEDNTLFGFQTKTLWGTRLEYAISKDISIGGTYMHVSERPFTQKVNIGDDPISNSVYGLDVNYTKDAPWLTRIVDKIPLINTKEPSQVSFTAEGAWLKPGHARALNDVDSYEDTGGTVYLDDFEGSVSNFQLAPTPQGWSLASVPNTLDFPEADSINNLAYGKNRAALSWYRIDATLRARGSNGGPTVYDDQITERNLFPNSTPDNNIANIDIRPFDIIFDPEERGPYNFDVEPSSISAGINSNGRLEDPRSRWAGIQRSFETNDFEEANYEFIQFWVLNPFMEGNGGNVGGELVFHLGSVSEDVLRDSRRFFEHGLPRPGGADNTDTTVWSRIPRGINAVNAFDNDQAVKEVQDVGLDGFDNEGERDHYSQYLTQLGNVVGPGILNQFNEDPSNDDYVQIKDPTYGDVGDPGSADIIDRYAKFNYPEGNSIGDVNDPNSSNLNTHYTALPDQEDINRDNTLSETESFFEYKINIQPRVGSNREEIADHPWIASSVEVIPADGSDPQNWYQFNIPLEEFTDSYGGIQDFRSIRFMRMYMRGWEDKTILRMAEFEMARSQWRRYKRPLTTAVTPDPNVTFATNSVNFEENSSKQPFPYVLPPGVQREQSLGSIQNAFQNEQSLSINVCDLGNQDARGVFKILNLDMRRYARLKMYVHAEDGPGQQADPGDISVFIRMGSDYSENYYEYEIPITMSTAISAGDSEADIVAKVWPEENEFNFPIELLRQAKIQRNALNFPLTDEYTIQDPEVLQNNVRIKGNPDLGQVRGIMIGVRNAQDVGPNLCAEVWVNELRVSGLDERGGLAGLARLDMKLADFGSITASGSYTGVGWGQLEDKVAQRSLEESIQYDVATNLELGKFLPKDAGVRIPFYAQYSRNVINPEFDPLQKDIKLKEILDAAPVNQRAAIRETAQDVTEVKSVNLTNVRKERTNSKRKPMPWDVENLSATYAWTNTTKRDPVIENDEVEKHRAALDYNFSRQVKYVEPFKKLIKSKSKWLGLVKDFNFNPLPNTVSFRNELNRHKGEITYRYSDALNNTYFDRRFTWDRTYGLQWNFTKGLNAGFNATNNATIDELDFNDGTVNDDIAREFMWDNFLDYGRTKNYQQSINASYTVPTKQIPLLDWTTLRANYTGGYTWSAAPLNREFIREALPEQKYRANIIQNNQSRQANADFDFTKLYNKSGYLKKINSKPKPKSKGGKTDKEEKGKDKGGKIKSPKIEGAKGKTPSNIKGELSEKAKEKLAKVTDPAAAKELEKKLKEKAKDKAIRLAKKAKRQEKRKKRQPTMAERVLIRPLMSVRKARFSYSENLGSVVPGWKPQTTFFGLNNWNEPGWDYVLGFYQPDRGWLDRAASEGSITSSLLLNQQVSTNRTLNLDGKVTIEPFKDFRIDVSMNRSTSLNSTEYFKVFEEGDGFKHRNEYETGSISLSFYTLNTMFEKLDKDYISATFKQFEANRIVISERLGDLNPKSVGQHTIDPVYSDGYGRYQQDVLIPSFIAAYTKKDASNYPLKIQNIIPRPNWRFTYNGLSKMEMFKNIFASFSVSHGYTSKLSMNSLETNNLFATDEQRDNNVLYENYNENTASFYSKYRVPDLVISEQFSPLIGIDMKFKNDLTAKFDWKKSRNLQMNLVDYQLIEAKTEEFTVGLGYRVKGLKLPFTIKIGKEKVKELENDLTFRFDLSIRDDITINHLLDQEASLPTRGLKSISWSPTIDYAVSKKLNVRLFFDRRRTIPATSESFPMTNTSGGVMISFKLTQ